MEMPKVAGGGRVHTELRRVRLCRSGLTSEPALFSSFVSRAALCQGTILFAPHRNSGSIFVPIFQLRKLRFRYVARILQLIAKALGLNPVLSAAQTQALNDGRY